MKNPNKSITLSLVQHKGGVGKTSISVNTAYTLGKQGFKVLLIDLDHQANASNHVGLSLAKDVTYSVCDILKSEAKFETEKAIQTETHFENVHLIGAKTDLKSIQRLLQSTSPIPNEILDLALASVKDKYDFIIIDCPPSFETLAYNALVTTDLIIAPINCSYALDGFVDILNGVQQLSRLNPNIKFLAPVLNQFNPRTNVHKHQQQMTEEMYGADLFNGRVYDYEQIQIPDSVRIHESMFLNESAMQRLSKSSKPYQAFKKISDLLIKYRSEQ